MKKKRFHLIFHLGEKLNQISPKTMLVYARPNMNYFLNSSLCKNITDYIIVNFVKIAFIFWVLGYKKGGMKCPWRSTRIKADVLIKWHDKRFRGSALSQETHIKPITSTPQLACTFICRCALIALLGLGGDWNNLGQLHIWSQLGGVSSSVDKYQLSSSGSDLALLL